MFIFPFILFINAIKMIVIQGHGILPTQMWVVSENCHK